MRGVSPSSVSRPNSCSASASARRVRRVGFARQEVWPGPGRLSEGERPMLRKWLARVGLAALAVALWAASGATAGATEPPLPRFYYYPYYYFPHSYWPANSPQWPEPKGHPYVRPPAYQAYPPFLEPNWRYELWTPMKYYRGNHFWLDQF